MNVTFFFVCIIAAFLFSNLPQANAQSKYLQNVITENYTVEFAIPTPDGTPQITYVLPSNHTEAFRVTFNHVFQATWASNSSKQLSMISEPMIPTGWGLNNFSSSNSSINVPCSCTPPTGSQAFGKLDGIRFDAQVPILSNTSWPWSYPVYKFNIEVSNLNWQLEDPTIDPDDALIVFSFTLEKLFLNSSGWTTVPFDTPLKMNQLRTVNFDKAYFSINTSAEFGETSSTVQILMASEAFGNSSNPFANPQTDVLLIYDYFTGDLMHDPEIGFGAGPGYHTFLIVFVVAIVTVIASIIVIVIGTILTVTRRKKRKLERIM